jgi:hypothetical protein
VTPIRDMNPEFIHTELWEYYLKLISPQSKYLWDTYWKKFNKFKVSLASQERRKIEDDMERERVQEIVRIWYKQKNYIVDEDFELHLRLRNKEDVGRIGSFNGNSKNFKI